MKYDLDLVLENDNSLSKIIKQIEPDSVVLEFGPANGRMTRYLTEKLNCKVYFVEIDEEAAKDVSKIAEDGIVGDIEEFEWLDKWSDIRFDYITFADVLEHLRNPENVLLKTKLLLKEEGKTIISVPNVAHNSLLINLYNNVFNYTPLGLLDDTHIHLFAYNTLVQVCNNVGYVPVIEDATYSAVGANEVCANYSQVPCDVRKILKRRKYGDVYQFLFTLQKKDYFEKNSIYVEKRIKPYNNDYKMQVFYDIGFGWQEDNCTTIFYRPTLEIVKFVISPDCEQKINKIRIDPVDSSCIVKINTICIEKKDGNIKTLDTNFLATNANEKINNIYIFYTDDPQIWLENMFEGEIDNIMIELSYINYEFADSEYLDAIDRIKLMKENELKLSKDELERRAEELENRMQLINSLRTEIGILNNTIINKSSEIEELNNIINNQTSEMAFVKNEIKLANEELDRRLIELNHRMEVINDRDRVINENTETIKKLTKTIYDYENSTSWKLTKPFREIVKKKS